MFTKSVRSTPCHNLKIFLLLLISAAFVQAEPVLNVWNNHGPAGATPTYWLSVSPHNSSEVFASTILNGTFRSVNAGDGWFLLSAMFARITIDPTDRNTMFRSSQFNVERTIDGGEMWSEMQLGAGGGGSIAIAPSDHRVVYVRLDAGLSVSTNGGETWSLRSAFPLPYPYPHESELTVDPFDPNLIYMSLSSDGCDSIPGYGLYRSTDAGITWAGIYTNWCVSAVKISPATPNIVYISTYDGRLFVSEDRGTTLHNVLPCCPSSSATALAVDPVRKGTLYAHFYDSGHPNTLAGAYRSTDYGTTWIPMNTGFRAHYVQDYAIDRTGRFLHAATELGVFSITVTPERHTRATTILSGNDRLPEPFK
jgi:hypothetical protein